MSSQAERKRRRKTSSIIRAEETRGRASGLLPATPRVIQPKTPYQRRKDGLTWLRDKGKLDVAQLKAGERYGANFRAAAIEDPAAIRSAWPANDAGGGVAGFRPPPTDMLAAAEWLAEAKRERHDVLFALGHHPGLVATCDAICGKGMTPREVTAVQAEAEQIECSLRIALDLLHRFYWPPNGAR